MQLKSILICTAMFTLWACNEKADHSGREGSKQQKDQNGTEAKDPKTLDTESELGEDPDPLVEALGEDEVKPAQKGEATGITSESILGHWAMKDTDGVILLNLTYTSSILSRQITNLKKYDFAIKSTDVRDDLIYTIHTEPVNNVDTDRYCIHKIVTEVTDTHMLVNCNNGSYPVVDWTAFTADNRYYKMK